MISTPTYLTNHQAVVDAFGYWPSFHDASVLEFEVGQLAADRIDLTLHVWEMTRELEEKGHFKLIKHHRVHFAFHGVFDEDLEQFVPENILDALIFSPASDFENTGSFRVFLDSAIGCEMCGAFSATAGEVLEVIPCSGSTVEIEDP
jgi:hypothetical protein